MNIYYSISLIFTSVTLLLDDVVAFSPGAAVISSATTGTRTQQFLTPLSMAVVDIDGEAAFDKTIKSAGAGVVIVDYSTTW